MGSFVNNLIIFKITCSERKQVNMFPARLLIQEQSGRKSLQNITFGCDGSIHYLDYSVDFKLYTYTELSKLHNLSNDQFMYQVSSFILYLHTIP